MKKDKLVTEFAVFSLIAIFGMIILFQETTLNAKAIAEEINVPHFKPELHERFLAREPCKYAEAILELGYEDCDRIGTLQCTKAYNIKPNYKGDVHTYPTNCLRQCIRDIQAQCEHTSSRFEQEGKR